MHPTGMVSFTKMAKDFFSAPSRLVRKPLANSVKRLQSQLCPEFSDWMRL
jgi:hypothetical protein